MYQKDFDRWNSEKKEINIGVSKKVFFPKERQVWYVKLGVNIGYEADGKGEFTRPVLIIRKIGSLFWCIPMTTKHKQNVFHYLLPDTQFSEDKKSSLMLSQSRVIDIKRFEEMVGYITKNEFEHIKKLLQEMYIL